MLQTGWTQGGSIIAAVMGTAVFKIINPKLRFTEQEAVMCTTAASAGGTMTSAAGMSSFNRD